MSEISLIPTTVNHFPIFFKFESDPVAVNMAAFANLATDFDAFSKMWQHRIESPRAVHRTILLGETIVGGMMSYDMEDHRCIGYWIDRNFWGKGIATEALKQFLEFETTRPLNAACIADNIGSRKVLEKNNFKYTHTDHHHAPARNQVVEETFFILD